MKDSQEWHHPQTMKTGSELHIHSATLNAGGDWTDDGSVRNGRLVGVRGGELPTITYRRAWINARRMAPTAAEQAHGGHACISYWRRLAHRLVDRDMD